MDVRGNLIYYRVIRGAGKIRRLHGHVWLFLLFVGGIIPLWHEKADNRLIDVACDNLKSGSISDI